MTSPKKGFKKNKAKIMEIALKKTRYLNTAIIEKE